MRKTMAARDKEASSARTLSVGNTIRFHRFSTARALWP